MRRYLPPTVLALAALLAVCLWLAPAAARVQPGESHTNVTEVCTPHDWAALRASVAAADTTTITYTAARAKTLSRGQWVVFQPRFAGSSDSCTIRAVFCDSDGTILEVGDSVAFTAGTEIVASLYPAEEGAYAWEAYGAVYAMPWVTDLSGTVTIWSATK